MLNTQENYVKIEGILSELSINESTFTKKDGTTAKALGGSIKVRVDQVINGESETLEIPVSVFASEMTNKGTKNPAYESIERVKNEFVSIAMSDLEHADRVRINGAKITMNEYYKNDQLVSFPRISASFINKITKAECKPEATFSVVFFVGEKGYDVDKDGVEIPNHYKVNAAIPQFGGSVDIVPFYATSENVINAINTYWEKGDTVKASGRLNFTSKTETKKTEVDFGEARETVHTVNISELVITGGNQTPIDGEMAFEPSDIQEGLKVRQAKLNELKAKAANKQTKPAKGSVDLGF